MLIDNICLENLTKQVESGGVHSICGLGQLEQDISNSLCHLSYVERLCLKPKQTKPKQNHTSPAPMQLQTTKHEMN